METPLNYARDNGVCIESCFPYQDRDLPCNPCQEWWVNGRKLKSYLISTSVAEMKQLLQRQPLVGTMTVYRSFLYYLSGVYHHLPVDDVVGYHAIAVVGYDDSLNAWLCRNSWGTGWGMRGYFLIAYGDSDIDVEMFYLEPDGPITPQPTPSPCGIGNGVAKALNAVAYVLKRKGRFYYLNK